MDVDIDCFISQDKPEISITDIAVLLGLGFACMFIGP